MADDAKALVLCLTIDFVQDELKVSQSAGVGIEPFASIARGKLAIEEIGHGAIATIVLAVIDSDATDIEQPRHPFHVIGDEVAYASVAGYGSEGHSRRLS